jgi:hypothetical protein
MFYCIELYAKANEQVNDLYKMVLLNQVHFTETKTHERKPFTLFDSNR